MNKKLHFTWGHIFAFIAIIFISYSSFMGISFKTGGDFLQAILITLGVIIVFILFFILPQQLKATESYFSKCIWVERVLIHAALPVALAFALIPQSPFTHFGAIVQKAPQIESQYQTTVNSFNDIVRDYDEYVSSRENRLDESMENNNYSPSQRNNRKQLLDIYLKPQHYVDYVNGDLKKYIDNAKSVKVWNVYTVSNVKAISESATSLVTTLTNNSSKIFSFEEGTKPYEGAEVLKKVNDNVSKLASLFRDNHWSWLSCILALLASFFMFVPYLSQQRNGKNIYGLYSNYRFTRQSLDDNEGDVNIVI